MASSYEVRELTAKDVKLASFKQPKATIKIVSSIGSGLARRPGDPPGRLWGIGDRGPNLKIETMKGTYGRKDLAKAIVQPGAKIMPAPEIGPMISELEVAGGAIRTLRSFPLRHPDGRLVSGLPPAGSALATTEPAFDLAGNPLGEDPDGADTEAIVALRDRTFWVSDEYGPSLMKIAADGTVTRRLAPGAGLPEIAGRRRLNRGFEGLTISDGEAYLYAAFQSALAVPTLEIGEACPFTRIWKIRLPDGAVVGQYLYPFDDPKTYKRDAKALGKKPKVKDLKIGDLAWLAPDRLLVLERMEEGARIYAVDLKDKEVDPGHLVTETRPTLEEDPSQAPALNKTLVLSTDRETSIAGGLECMALLDARTLILATDNDYGTEGKSTSAYQIRFEKALV